MNLRKLVVEKVLETDEFVSSVDSIARDIVKASKSAPNEATMATNFELKLYGFMKSELGVEFEPIKEDSINTKRHVKKGRIDARIGALVIEYKHHSALSSDAAKKQAESQLTNYLEHITQNGQSAIGVITDGLNIKFILMTGSVVESETPFETLTGSHLTKLIRGVLSTDKKALTAKNLVTTFCSENGLAKRLARKLFELSKSAPTGRTNMLFSEWQTLFRLAHDDDSKQQAIEDRRKSLMTALDAQIKKGDNITEYLALYSIQTAYAIIVKVIANKTLLEIRGNGSDAAFKDLASADVYSLRSHMESLESGSLFRSEGFGNLLEGDFFAWYCTSEQWTDDLANLIREVFSVLLEYENQSIFSSDHVQDLFKDLYQGVIPDKVRHSLGEFYTPPWLADHTIDAAVSASGASLDWRALDPCCGSGTFLTVCIRKVLEELQDCEPKEKLQAVLKRVKGVDLNPLATLTARINYFINIAHLIDFDSEFDIPVYLGNSANLPKSCLIGDIECVEYSIGTEKGNINIRLPLGILRDVEVFSKTMSTLEVFIENEDSEGVAETLLDACDEHEKTTEVINSIKSLSEQLVDLQRERWDGIWARIICNFLTTYNLGKFDVIVGNPPWIDWKNLPQGYREQIKNLCISKNLFSGDSVTGGINLNICALITSVTAENWLAENGALAFLMPETIIFQQSYEGFRRLSSNPEKPLYFTKLINWTKSGHPFKPVQQKFLTFLITAEKQDYSAGIEVETYVKRKANAKSGYFPLEYYSHATKFKELEHEFVLVTNYAAQLRETSSGFTYLSSRADIPDAKLVAGETEYKGREGVEIYPQELFLLEIDTDKPERKGKVYAANVQLSRSKHKVARQNLLIEKDYLQPLIKGVQIERFGLKPSNIVVPFPYEDGQRAPVSAKELAKNSPELMRYFNKNKSYFESQTSYNDRIIGSKNATEFYSLARVGEYSYADYFVAFRDNTKWGATVVSNIETPWGELKRPVFQNHAVTITQRPDGKFITETEAHFICAFLNSSPVSSYILSSNDSRSFKINPPVNLPVFDEDLQLHLELADLSKQAHAFYSKKALGVDVEAQMDSIDLMIDDAVRKLLTSITRIV